MDLLCGQLINQVYNLEELRAVQVLRHVNEKRDAPIYIINCIADV
jgi:hypothetical protein